MVGGNRAGLIKMLYASGFRGKALETAFAVALAESGGRANAFNDKGRDLSYGLFQINMKDNDPSSPNMGRNRRKQFGMLHNKELFDPKKNMAAAFQISNKGTWWKQWGAFTNGTFAKYLDDAHTAAKDAGIGGDSGQAGMALATESTRTHAVGGGGHMSMTSRNATINVYVDMDVKLASLSKFELQKAAGELRSAVDRELRVKGIGAV